MTVGDHNISFIAHYTAQVWVREHLPWAWRFDTRTGRAFYDSLAPLWRAAAHLGLTTPPDFLVQRHRMMDALVRHGRPEQLVELAGGLSPRGLALSHKLGVRCVDVDLPKMVELKAELLGDHRPGSYRQAALDLVASHDYRQDLESVLATSSPIFVITEGILPYFSLRQVQVVFDRVAALIRGCGGGTYLTDIYHQDEVTSLKIGELFRSGLHLLACSPKHSMVHDFSVAERMFRQAGFDEVVAHHPRHWRQQLDLPLRRWGSGLRVYEAKISS